MSKLFLLICNKDLLVAVFSSKSLSEALAAPLYPKIINDSLGSLPPLSLRHHRLLCSVCLHEPVFKSFSLRELILLHANISTETGPYICFPHLQTRR